MKKIILTRGCPGSGKTTWAKEYIKCNSGFFIVCRDDIRSALFGLTHKDDYKFTKSRESTVTTTQFEIAKSIISKENTKGIIIADTNINKNTVNKWTEFAKNHQCKLEFQDFHVNWNVLVERNSVRGHDAVPIGVLRDMYKNWEGTVNYDSTSPENLSKPKTVIFDIDGTLAKMTNRGPYELDKLGSDVINPMVVELLNMLNQNGYTIITVSGRESGHDNIYYNATIKWLKDKNIWPKISCHYQRAAGDFRPDYVIKEEIFLNIVKKYNVVLAIDDRDSVVEMWRRMGIECWQVNFGNF